MKISELIRRLQKLGWLRPRHAHIEMRRPGYSRKFKTIGSVNEFDLNVILINFLETGFELEVVDASNDCKIAFYKGKGKKRKMAIAPCTYKNKITLTDKQHLKSAPLSSPYGNAAKRTKPVSHSCCRKKWYLPEQQPMPMVSSPASTSLHRFVCLGKKRQAKEQLLWKGSLETNFAIWLKGYGTLSMPALLKLYLPEARRVMLAFSITCFTFCSWTKAYSMISRCCGKPFETECENVLRSMQDCF